LSALLALVALTWMAGCATSSAGGRHSIVQGAVTPPDCFQDCGGFGFWEERDDFQLLQKSAELEEDSWHEAGEDLETDDAQALWEALARTGTTLQSFGPRRSLAFVLRQVRTRDDDVPYAELLQRLRPYHFLVVMRPDGYLVSALSGRPLQRMGMGRVELREGRLMVGAFEVGAFYRDKGGVFYAVDDSLSRPGAMVGELGLERDWFNAALDGGGDALGEMAQALAQFVNDPIQSLEGLGQLPSAVAALIASSPDYFARYSALPMQEQIREAARLATHLMMLYGSAAGTATRIGTASTRLPVLSLSAEGALAIEQVAVPVGASAAALGTGAGAVYVLMESTKDLHEGGGAQASGAAKGAGGGFKPFTADNFRENLARLTGKMPERAHAHHAFPQVLEDKFKKVGINIHDPKFGAWWERSSHLKNAAEYLRRWQKFFEHDHTFDEILQLGRELGDKYGFQVNY
jgi:hypothetical protein